MKENKNTSSKVEDKKLPKKPFEKKIRFKPKKIELKKIKIDEKKIDFRKKSEAQKIAEREILREQAVTKQAMKIMAGDKVELAKIEKAEMDELFKLVGSKDNLIQKRALERIEYLVKGKDHTDKNVEMLLKQKSPVVRELQRRIIGGILKNNLELPDLKKLRDMANGEAKKRVEEFAEKRFERLVGSTNELYELVKYKRNAFTEKMKDVYNSRSKELKKTRRNQITY